MSNKRIRQWLRGLGSGVSCQAYWGGFTQFFCVRRRWHFGPHRDFFGVEFDAPHPEEPA